MSKVIYKSECDELLVKKMKVAVIGYGSQGHAHSLNLRESGVDVVIGMYNLSSESAKKASDDNFEVLSIADAVRGADLVSVLIPDENQKDVYENAIVDNLKDGAYLLFAHGLNIHFDIIKVPKNVNVIMVAPKSPGHMVRRTYVNGGGVPALVSVYQSVDETAIEVAKSYACAIGSGGVGIIETSFKEETETDLFGEQAVLCGGVTELMKVGFETLVDRGYSHEMAYFECVHEMKLIIDMIYESGFEKMRESISNTAEFGDYYTGQKIITAQTRVAMDECLDLIVDKTFVNDFLADKDNGFKTLHENRHAWDEHPIEVVGRKLRGMFNGEDSSK
jgi:ketol-acid reductoisomerase